MITKIIRTSLIVLIVSALFFSCRKEDEFTTDKSAMLAFSADSVLFDTVFTASGTNKPLSVTKQLWVYNNNANAVKVNISLKGNQFGIYKLNIDGQPTNAVSQKEIRGKDSIIIFVQMYIDNNGLNDPTKPFFVADQIIFETNGNIQDVVLFGYSRVAHYLRNQVLDCASNNMHWTADTPYVIYDSILIPHNCTLTIDAGTHIYSHVKSCFLVSGTLIVNGTTNNPVIFEGDRMEPDYTAVPGQWIGIRFLTDSKDNVIKNVLIKNALVGVEVDSSSVNTNPKLNIQQSIILNMSAFGIAGFTADILAVNNLVANCGQSSFYGVLGGNYNLYQNTFATFANIFSRTTPTFIIDNSPLTDANGITVAAFPLNVDSKNNIIYGSQDDEILLNTKADGGNATGTLTIQNCLIKTSKYATTLNVANNIINQDPQFNDFAKYDYDLKGTSPAKSKGANIGVSIDLKGKARTTSTPTIGCYE